MASSCSFHQPVAGTLTEIPPMIRRKIALRSKTADTLFHIFSFFYKNQLSDKGGTDIGHITKDDVPLVCTDILPNDSLCQEDMSMDETRVVLDTQEVCLFNTQSELAESDVNDQDNLMDLKMSSSPSLPTDKDVEEEEISGGVMDFKPKDLIGIESQLENVNNLVLLSTVAVAFGNDMSGIVNKNKKNLADYSEIVHGNSREPAKQATTVIGYSSLQRCRRVLPSESNLRNSKTRNQDLVKPVKRQGSFTREDRVYKKTKKLVDLITCPENINLDASRKVVDASVNKDAANEKKKKRVVTQESKAKKKVAWEHVTQHVEENGNKVFICNFCRKIIRGGGITRVKKHLAGRKGGVTPCMLVDPDVRFAIQGTLKGSYHKSKEKVSNIISDDDDDEEQDDVNLLYFKVKKRRTVRTRNGVHRSKEVAESNTNTSVGPRADHLVIQSVHKTYRRRARKSHPSSNARYHGIEYKNYL